MTKTDVYTQVLHKTVVGAKYDTTSNEECDESAERKENFELPFVVLRVQTGTGMYEVLVTVRLQVPVRVVVVE